MMTKLIKLTDTDDKSYRGTQWGENVTHTAPGGGPLCSASWLHAYTDAALAAFIWRAHLQWYDVHAWEAEGEVGITAPDKVGCTSLTTIRRIELPEPTTEQWCKFALLCANAVRHLVDDPRMETWDRWANGDKTVSANAAYAAAYAAADAAAAYAANAAYAAAYAAYAAAYAAYAAYAANAAYADADAAYAAKAANAAAYANLDLVAIAHQAFAHQVMEGDDDH
jgi:hypothetical protein